MAPKPEPEDRLTALPDELLHRIFSFLDPIHIFQASFLSRRCRRLLPSTPVLSFSFAAFRDRFGRTRSDARFVGFVMACLAARDWSFPLQEFVFNADDGRVEPEKIELLVIAAARLGVRRLELAGDFFKLRLPACLYESRSLKELRLQSPFISLSNVLGFPALTKLHLELFRFSEATLDCDILSRCPNLETLILTNCNTFHKSKQFKITAPKLTKLAISYRFDLWYLPGDCEFVINTPMLASFCYHGSEALNCRLVQQHLLLDKVEMDVFQGKGELLDGGLPLDEKIRKVSGLIRMINVFKRARTVKLSCPTIKCLRQASSLGLEDYCDDRFREILQGTTGPVSS